MDPFTPRPRTVGRKNNLSLSTKEYAKVCNTSIRQFLILLTIHPQVTGTIASARRNRNRLGGEEQTNGRVSPSAELRWRGASCTACCPVDFVELRLEPSFISEESFVRAPLNSRIVSGTTTTKSKGKAKEESLDLFPLEVQEALILEDLLYVLLVCAPRSLDSSFFPDAMIRVSKGPISHITKITRQKTMMRCRAFDSQPRNG
jgi:gamma-tubulin complex component 2